NLHVAAVFIIMGVSFLGTIIPIFGQRFSFLRVGTLCIKLFGSGVILATAFVHMIAPAVQTLTNPCLPDIFANVYPSFAGAFALLGLLSTHFLQFMSAREMHKRLPKSGRSSAANTVPVAVQIDAPNCEAHMEDEHIHGLMLMKEKRIATYILEMGVASHSIIIGVAIGVSRGTEFRSLLTALTFHQFFEGMALSTVVIDSKFKGRLQTYLLVGFYALTTPLGAAIGIGISAYFNGNGVGFLIATGVLDAISGGILIYDALVNIVAIHFSSEQFRGSKTGHQFIQVLCLWLGAALMSLIGLWA
ncbi:Zinc/iron permease, partial [Polychytrium aggregatum]|uniref:Zinc/iron permease n=1 Tax=Polychytrium aggregatum TaxID=110093 RepID=UPI0022FEEE63